MADGIAIGDMDFDGDGRTNAQEWEAGSNAFLADTPPTPRAPGVSEDMEANMKTVRDGAQKATDDFHKSMDDADGVAESISAVGTYIEDLADPVGKFGDGLGESLEESIQKGFGSEGVGTGFLSETAEAFFGVVGEGAEMIAEATGGLSDAVMVAVGGTIDTVGDIGTNLKDAGSALLDGDIGEAGGFVVDAVKSGLGLAEVAVDTGAAAVSAAFEVVEGVGAMGAELVEGVGEMGIGLGRNLVDAGAAIGGVVADGAGYAAEAASDAYDYASEAASDAYDTVSDAASDAYDAVSDFFSY